MNCSSFRSRNNLFVVSSNLRVMWSNESGVPYFEFLSFSDKKNRKIRIIVKKVD